MGHSPNRVLASLPPDVIAKAQPYLKVVELKPGEILADVGSAVQRIYFPHSAVISLVVELGLGDIVETAMVGCDGVLNAASAFDGKISFNKAIVRLPGLVSVIDVDVFHRIGDESSLIRSIITRHEQVLLAQSQQTAACNASHPIEARMSRWLLRMHDLVGDKDLLLTQDLLAQMLGVRRPSVSIAAHALQQHGLIKYTRGSIRILDLLGLERLSCECYGVIRAHYERLLIGQSQAA